nr:unnamed protein product [Digitaria exilis]
MRLPPVRFLPSSAAPAVVDANARIARLARAGNIEGARAAFEAMPLRTTASYNALLAGYFRNNLPDAALRVFERMPSRDLASYNALISGLTLRRHTLPDAAAALATIPYPPSVITFTSLLRGYVRHGLLADAIRLFRQMPERNHISYTVLLGGFLDAGRVDEARGLFDEMPAKDVVAWTAMLSGYCQAGRIAEARALFDEMPKRNVVSWTAMVSGYAQNGQVNLARKLFEVMPERNEVSWTAMLFGYIQAGRVEDAEELFNAMPEHPLPACNAMIVGFGQRGMVDAAKAVFERMRERDDGTWSAIIKAYEQNEFLMEALSTFREMLHDGIRPNYPSVISILTVCAALAVLDYGKEVHAAMLRCSFDKDIFAVSALITMYIKCGNLDKAKKAFNMFEPKDVVMWNSMITGYAQHGLGEEALRIFDDMTLAGMVPDGLLEEALDLIKTMPLEPDAVIWGALMGACRMHKNAEIAEAKVYWFRSRLSMWLRFHRMNKKRLQDSRVNEATICLDDYEEDNVDTSPCGMELDYEEDNVDTSPCGMECGKEEKGHDGEGGSNVDATPRERKKCGEKEKGHAGERDDKKKLDSAGNGMEPGFRLPRVLRERHQEVYDVIINSTKLQGFSNSVSTIVHQHSVLVVEKETPANTMLPAMSFLESYETNGSFQEIDEASYDEYLLAALGYVLFHKKNEHTFDGGVVLHGHRSMARPRRPPVCQGQVPLPGHHGAVSTRH